MAWLLHRSPVMLPIPGTSSVAHLEENMKAAEISLSDAEMKEIEAAAAGKCCSHNREGAVALEEYRVRDVIVPRNEGAPF